MTNTKKNHVTYTYVIIISNENVQKIVVIAMCNVMICTNKSWIMDHARNHAAKEVSSRSGLIASQASSKPGKTEKKIIILDRCRVDCVGRYCVLWWTEI